MGGANLCIQMGLNRTETAIIHKAMMMGYSKHVSDKGTQKNNKKW